MLDVEVLNQSDPCRTRKKVGLKLGELVQDLPVASCITFEPHDYPGGWAQMPFWGVGEDGWSPSKESQAASVSRVPLARVAT